MDLKNKRYTQADPVAVAPLGEYAYEEARVTLNNLLSSIGAIDFVNKGMRVVIKANLVSAMKPEEAATTHPVLISAPCSSTARIPVTL